MNYAPYNILLIVFAIALYFIFRKKKITIINLNKHDKQLLLENVEFYQNLDQHKKQFFEQKVAHFIATIIIAGVNLEITQLDKLLVASSAVIPIFGFDNWEYKNLINVLLYPDTFNKEFEFEGGERNIMGMVGTGYLNGQMVLSKSALYYGFSKNAGKGNTGIHEFVHLLDKSDGATDGIPENLIAHEYTLPWLQLMHEKMKSIEENQSDINPYALTNQAEFFAVASEYFFEKPELLKEKHPKLYKHLSRIFSQDIA